MVGDGYPLRELSPAASPCGSRHRAALQRRWLRPLPQWTLPPSFTLASLDGVLSSAPRRRVIAAPRLRAGVGWVRHLTQAGARTCPRDNLGRVDLVSCGRHEVLAQL